jgi:hypothetical protein
MAEYLVTCATKPNRFSAHDNITRLGGPSWSGTHTQVIGWINAGNTLFTLAEGRRAIVAPWPNTRTGPYVRTHADGEWNDNLLALPECG